MLKMSKLVLAFIVVCAVVAQATELRLSSKTHLTCQVAKDSVSISISGLTHSIGSFRLALALDEAEYSLLTVHPGSFMTSCQWEYLNWKVDRNASIPQSQYSMGTMEFQASAILEITGFATTSPQHAPTCFGNPGDLELASIVLLVAQTARGHTTECEYLPVRFFWRDCGDNVLTSLDGDSAFTVDYVSEPGVPGTTNPSGYTFPGFGAPSSVCDSATSRLYATDMEAINGGFDIICVDSSCRRGDLNLNEIPNEVSDIVTYENYFTDGIITFAPRDINASIAQSDVNGDGITLSVADLVYLIRLVVGELP
jgi:hypothetical protein